MKFAVLRFTEKRAGIVERFLSDAAGATAIEYGLIAALIAVVIIGAIGTVGTSLSGTFNSVSTVLGSN
jgi:pilus assembly protein Flp/PilA